MDIEKEFKQFNSTSEGTREVVYDLYRQKNEIEKKIHIFNVLCLSKQMAQFVNEKISSANVSALNIRHYRDYESGGNNIIFDLLDLEGKAIESDALDKKDAEVMDEQQSDIWGKCMDLLSANGLLNIDTDFINPEFKEDVWMSISLLKNTENEILDLFLNKEFKNIIQFHQIQNSLPINVESGKKLKI